MTDNDKKAWFPAKKYGWGWGFPNTWQGRMTFAIYILFLLAGIFVFESTAMVPELALLLYVFGITAVLLGMCWWKGEKPRWRWGGK